MNIVLYGCCMGFFMGGILTAAILSEFKFSTREIVGLSILWPITAIVWLISTIILGIKKLPKVWKQ